MSDAQTCLACGCTRDMPNERRLEDFVVELRRQLAARDKQVDRLRAAELNRPQATVFRGWNT